MDQVTVEDPQAVVDCLRHRRGFDRVLDHLPDEAARGIIQPAERYRSTTDRPSGLFE
ncbi:hypothetical protein AB0A71_27740 [Kitasatospora aureofaciens]|uniref:hypothetical protein n=1 Tax=Kitasatospora aureofaciens TaxID=1894 RepID=UPI0033F61463